jgi:hypothetical protein
MAHTLDCHQPGGAAGAKASPLIPGTALLDAELRQLFVGSPIPVIETVTTLTSLWPVQSGPEVMIAHPLDIYSPTSLKSARENRGTTEVVPDGARR